MSSARAAVLEVTKSERGSETHFTYTLSTSPDQFDLPITLSVEVRIRSQLIDTLCTEVQLASEQSTDHSQRLRRLGTMLYRMLFPGQLPEARLIASRLADWTGALIVSSNDADIPWELMHDDQEFLGTRLALGRRMITRHLFQPGRKIGQVRRALLVSNPTEDLPSSDAETAKLAAFLRQRGVECTILDNADARCTAVSHELTDGGHDLFHYTGHVGVDDNGRAGLRLFDQPLSSEVIHALLAPPAGRPDAPAKAPPVVFINGCRSAEHLSSVCGAFLNTGSHIVMGTRYRIIDEAAREFAETWYGNLLGGMTAGQALQDCRTALRDGETGTWASFVLYGQPATQLWVGAAPIRTAAPEPVAAEPVSQPEVELKGAFWAENAHPLEPAATALVGAALSKAADFGIVTSFHLAAGLVAHQSGLNALSAAIEASEVEHVIVVDALDLFTSAAGAVNEGAAGGTSGEPDLSENVRDVFAKAVALANGEGRQRISVDDLANAFVATGGGHAGELLRQLGVEMAVGDSLFSQDGLLQPALLSAQTQRAMECAHFLAGLRGEVISSYVLVLGFALAGSPVLREALLDQGTHGELMLRALFSEGRRLNSRSFSHRAHLALDRALAAGGGTVEEAAVLAELLRDPGSAASQLIQTWKLDVERLRLSCLAAIEQPRPEASS